MAFTKRLSAFVFSLIVCAVLFPASAIAQTESELQENFMEFLADEGIEGWIDSDGDIQFEYNDHNYFIEVNEGDPEFFRLVLFNIWPIESQTEAVQVAFAVDAVNRELKVVKAYTTNDNVWLAMEVFLSDINDYKSFFMRGLGIIEDGIDTFVSEM